MPKVKVGVRVSAFNGPGNPRRFGLVVHALGTDNWTVRYDDTGEEVEINAAALKCEAECSIIMTADELWEPQYLPLKEHREELIFGFDTAAHDFRQWFVQDVLVPAVENRPAMLQISPDAPAPPGAFDGDPIGMLLSNLHSTPVARQRAQQLAGKEHSQRANRTLWHSAYNKTLRASVARDSTELVARRGRFESMLRTFMREVIAPLLGCGPDEVAYQASPTLRVSYPSATAMGHPHCDYEYHHQPCEVNLWLPLTQVWGNNTLHAESAPGKGDFRPFELGWGRCVRFWGNQVRHFTCANDTGFTRVSLDLRCLDASRYNPAFVDGRGNKNKFRLGQYYALSALQGRSPC